MQVAQVVTEVGSGRTDARPRLLALRADHRISLMAVEHQDHLARFGFRHELKAVFAKATSYHGCGALSMLGSPADLASAP
jgi:predicted site-specific integrase-resolvase